MAAKTGTQKTKVKAKAQPNQGKVQALPQQKKVAKLTAAQRLDMLERLVLQFSQRFTILADEIDRLRSTVQGVNKRLTASITATDSEDAVKDIITKNNVEELEGRVKFLVDRGVLVKNDEMTIVDKSFVVGRDINEEGKVLNPRVQFSVETLPQDLKDTILGKKLGDMVKPEGADTSLEILEVYEIHEVNVEQQFAEAQAEEAEQESEDTEKSEEASQEEAQAEA